MLKIYCSFCCYKLYSWSACDATGDATKNYSWYLKILS